MPFPASHVKFNISSVLYLIVHMALRVVNHMIVIFFLQRLSSSQPSITAPEPQSARETFMLTPSKVICISCSHTSEHANAHHAHYRPTACAERALVCLQLCIQGWHCNEDIMPVRQGSFEQSSWHRRNWEISKGALQNHFGKINVIRTLLVRGEGGQGRDVYFVH